LKQILGDEKMKSGNFFGELKRRNVYKVAIAYALVSWLVVQAASILFDTFEAPAWAMKVFIVAVVLGFPIAIVLAWAFELTPEGIKRESEVATGQPIARQTGRRIVGLTVVVAIVAGGLLVFQLLRSKSQGTSGASTAASREATGADSAAIPEESIAVLPFQSLSDDKANAYFADGIQDEILTRLSKIAALKVISRTSTQKYKSAPDNLREIGKELGVAHLLEGTVHKVANSVKINVQLIRAATDEHIWAESYNRKLDDVFGVEGEVAGAIAEQLNARLTGAEAKAVADKPTQNAAAYDAYLRGLSVDTGGSVETSNAAAAGYTEAVRLDPGFGLAWARLAIVRSHLYFNGVDPAVNSGAAVKDAADHALELSPESGEAWVAQGVYRYRVLRDFPAALKSYAEALKRLPNSALVLEQMGHVERRLGQLDLAEKHYQAAAQLDPRNVDTMSTVVDLLLSVRRFKEAEAVLDRILQILPANEGALATKAFLFQAQGRLDESAKELSKIPATSEIQGVVFVRTVQLTYERRFDAAITELERSMAPGKAPDPRLMVLLGYCQRSAGRKDQARTTFMRAVSAMKPSRNTVVPVDARRLSSYLAWAYAGLGDKDKALEQAQRAVKDYQGDVSARPFAETTLAQIQAHFGDSDSAIAALPYLLEVPNGLTRANLRLDPLWDPLRKDPRFAKLITEP
jgi:TolB-like protein/Tfp pilus assembly protein PilF